MSSNEYISYIKQKYEASKDQYLDIMTTEEDIGRFMIIYENLNIYPTFPAPVIFPLKISGEVFKNTKPFKTDDKYRDMVYDKTKEFDVYYKKKTTDAENKIRRYFDYEIRDAICEMTGKRVTNAWVKMYEILVTYKFPKKNELQSFHICEHPGKFIYAIRDYNGRGKHKFVFQSLNPEKNKDAFNVDKTLLNKPNGTLDYGSKNTGDITDIDNINYYISSYSGMNLVHRIVGGIIVVNMKNKNPNWQRFLSLHWSPDTI
jgi:hypothetical protein